MSTWVVGDRLMVEAFELAGIPGRIPSAGEGAGAVLEELARSQGAKLLLIDPAITSALPQGLVEQLAQKYGCLVLDIPGVGESAPEGAALARRLRRAVGIEP
jgi:vacuolar-type H+-ATPase subunit F/Vma7